MILKDRYTKYFLLLLFGLFILRMILLGQFNLVPQEAYYWLYIQKPALSYFDHPPVCSYTIGIFTYIFGNTEFGVRFGMLLYSLGTSIFVFLLGKMISGSTRFAFLSVVFLNLTVFFNLHSVVATPDAPLLFFWSASMYFYFKAINEGNKSSDWLLAGVFAGVAMASKYTAFFIFFSLFLYLILTKNWKEFLSWKLWLSVVVALLVFSPVIIWNFQNGWASFLFQTSHRAKGVRSFGFNYFFQLIASQIFELTPLFFVLLWIILWRIIKRFTALSKEKLFFACFAFPVVLFFFAVSFTSLVKMNWILPAYLSFMLLVADYYETLSTKGKKVFNSVGGSTSLGLILLTLIIIVFPVVPIEKGDTWTGWRELASKVVQLKSEMDKEKPTFIFSNEYKIPAELAFYTPYREHILAENVYGKPALQFDFWFDVHKFSGWNALFIYSDFNPFGEFKRLEEYFERVEFHEELQIVRRGIVFRRFFIYKCYNYLPNKKIPTDVKYISKWLREN